MPTYSVFVPRGQLSAGQKATIAAHITQTHSEVTGAQGFFAQVVFTEVEPGDWFMGGRPLKAKQLFLSGAVRGGRPPDMKARLLEKLRDGLAADSGLAKTSIWCYLVELPPSHMIEYGYVLPEPGHERTWLSQMPSDDRRLMETIGL